MTRAQVLDQYPNASPRGNRYEDFICLTPTGSRVGYASNRLLHTLTASQRNQVRGRVVLALTANPHYALDGIHPNTSLTAAAHTLQLSRVMHVGRNDWYMAPNGSSTAVLKVRHGTVQERSGSPPRASPKTAPPNARSSPASEQHERDGSAPVRRPGRKVAAVAENQFPRREIVGRPEDQPSD